MSKCAVLSYGSNDTFSDSLAESVQTLWSLSLPATVVACAGVNKHLNLICSDTEMSIYFIRCYQQGQLLAFYASKNIANLKLE